MGRTKLSAEDTAAIWEGIQRGTLNLTQAGKLYGVSPDTVRKALVRHGHRAPSITDEDIAEIQGVMRALGRRLKKADFEGQLSHLHGKLLEQFGSVDQLNRSLWDESWSIAKRRKCLVCDRVFVSRSLSHRICGSDNCRSLRRSLPDNSWMGELNLRVLR